MSVSRPEKRNPQTNDAGLINQAIGYNQACDDWQAYHTQEIAEVVAVYDKWKEWKNTECMGRPDYKHESEIWQAIKNLALKAKGTDEKRI